MKKEQVNEFMEVVKKTAEGLLSASGSLPPIAAVLAKKQGNTDSSEYSFNLIPIPTSFLQTVDQKQMIPVLMQSVFHNIVQQKKAMPVIFAFMSECYLRKIEQDDPRFEKVMSDDYDEQTYDSIMQQEPVDAIMIHYETEQKSWVNTFMVHHTGDYEVKDGDVIEKITLKPHSFLGEDATSDNLTVTGRFTGMFQRFKAQFN